MTVPRRHGDPAGAATAACVVAAVALAGWVWASAEVSWRISTGRWLSAGAANVVAALVALPRHLSQPASALGGAPGRHPSAFSFYAAATLVLVVGAVVALAVARAVHAVGPNRLQGRPGPRRRRPEGSRWATSSEMGSLRVRLRAAGGGRLVLGRAGRSRGGGRLIATEARHSVLVLGPTQSGKTSGLAIPSILEWRGPVIATSVKDDLARATFAWREQRGPLWVFDPTGGARMPSTSRWSPLTACADWSSAQKAASWLVDATPARAGMADAAFWYAAAAKQLAPLLLAASSAGMTMAEVVRWTNTLDFGEPAQLLQLAGETDAAVALSACESRDDRIRSSVSTTLETVLSPFEDPVVASWTSGSDVDIGLLLESSGTLYLCGPSHEQNRVQSLFAVLVSSVVAGAVERVAATGKPLDPPLLLVLDEAANIAPVRDLDTLASTGAGLGIQLVTVCQDLGQLNSRYGSDRSRTIVNNHRAKLLLSGVSDLPTLDLLSGLAGEQAVREETFTLDQRDGRSTRSSAVAFRRLAPADELRRVAPGEAVLVYGHLPPIRLSLRPWYADRRLRQRSPSRTGAKPAPPS